VGNENHLLVTTHRDGYQNLWLLDNSGQSRTNVASEPYIEHAGTTLLGSKSIVFSSKPSGEFHIWSFNADSNVYTQLTFGPGYDDELVISPNGKWIVYTS